MKPCAWHRPGWLLAGLSSCCLAQQVPQSSQRPDQPISLHFQNIEVRAALYALAEFAGRNMLVNDSVSGQISLRLREVSWQQALELILQARGLEQQLNGDIIHIGRADEWLAQDKQRFEVRRQRSKLQPASVAVFALRHRQAADIKKLLEEGRVLSEQGSLLVDSSTNTLLLNDTEDTAAKVDAFLRRADIPLRQVLIEARIVEANDNFSRHLGVKLGFARVRAPAAWATGAGDAPLSGATPQRDLVAGVNLPVAAPHGNIAALFRANASALIALELQAMQAQNQGQVISSPRLLTADQAEASIEEGSEIPYTHISTRGATSTSFKKAALSLKVRPQVAADHRSLWIEIEISKDSPNFRQQVGGAPSVDTKRIHTRVQVENGGTVVLGGIFIEEQSQLLSQVPGLGEVPLLGALFRSRQTQHQRRELLVFITPRIISSAESGLP